MYLGFVLSRWIAPLVFPEPGFDVLAGLVHGKLEMQASPVFESLYRVHVVECETLEVSSHRVLIDPGCPESRGSAP